MTAAAAAVLAASGLYAADKVLQVSALIVGIVLAEQGYLDYAGGNPKAMLKALYRGRAGQTAEDLNAPLRLEISDGDPTIHIYNRNGKAGEWDFSRLCRVTESDDIFDLCRSGFPRQYLALPKSAFREGGVDEFRSEMNRRLGGKKSVERFSIPERRQKQLLAAKYSLFVR